MKGNYKSLRGHTIRKTLTPLRAIRWNNLTTLLPFVYRYESSHYIRPANGGGRLAFDHLLLVIVSSPTAPRTLYPIELLSCQRVLT